MSFANGKGFTRNFLKLMADLERVCCGNGNNNLFAISIQDTNSINLSGNGKVVSPLIADVKISALPGNTITVFGDGLYAQAPSGTPAVLNASNGNSLFGGDVVWGNDLNGSPDAVLTSDREIPFDTFSMQFTDSTNGNGNLLFSVLTDGIGMTLTSIATGGRTNVITPLSITVTGGTQSALIQRNLFRAISGTFTTSVTASSISLQNSSNSATAQLSTSVISCQIPGQGGCYLFPAQITISPVSGVVGDGVQFRNILTDLQILNGANTLNFIIGGNGRITVSRMPVFANDAAAGAGGLTVKQLYQTSTGEVRIKL